MFLVEVRRVGFSAHQDDFTSVGGGGFGAGGILEFAKGGLLRRAARGGGVGGGGGVGVGTWVEMRSRNVKLKGEKGKRYGVELIMIRLYRPYRYYQN